ncbi:MAG: hypothetical protein J6S14_15590 [Clostridia bacterium]|nr:hypothetical protein [Clostridia bacterium]
MPEQKSVWFRLGASIHLTDEEYELCKTNKSEGEKLLREKILHGEYELDGESYCPDGCWPGENDPDYTPDEDDYEVGFHF